MLGQSSSLSTALILGIVCPDLLMDKLWSLSSSSVACLTSHPPHPSIFPLFHLLRTPVCLEYWVNTRYVVLLLCFMQIWFRNRYRSTLVVSVCSYFNSVEINLFWCFFFTKQSLDRPVYWHKQIARQRWDSNPYSSNQPKDIITRLHTR